jgi:ATP-dependent DNA helicase RecG
MSLFMRGPALNPLFADATTLPGVGPAVARALKRLQLNRVRDLLFHLPTGWARWRRVHRLAECTEGERVILPVTVLAHDPGTGRLPFRARCLDADRRPIRLVYFGKSGSYSAPRLPLGATRLVSGKLERFNDQWQMVHPDRITEHDEGTLPNEPVYPLTAGLPNRRLASVIAAAATRAPDLPEWIDPPWSRATPGPPGTRRSPPSTRTPKRLPRATDSPTTTPRQPARLGPRPRPPPPPARHTPAGRWQPRHALIESLPFTLTGAQQRAARDIAGDMAQRSAMLRLLQGDVGSGKTVVALLAILTAVEAGKQAAFLAPTDLLARQHLATLQRLLGDLPVRVGFLVGREKGKGRSEPSPRSLPARSTSSSAPTPSSSRPSSTKPRPRRDRRTAPLRASPSASCSRRKLRPRRTSSS